MIVSLVPRNSSLTAKQGYHDNTEHNYVSAFVFKKLAARLLEISCEEIEKLALKAVSKNAVKSTKTWMFGSRGQKEKVILTMTLSNTKLKNWMNLSRARFFAEIRKSDGSNYEPESLRVMLAPGC